ncbi:Uma2 family endonuclease [Caldicellulosiruptor morganii]|uniref:Uma2 family endonuclease n=1 Tax=Caldicellulosiruptor morganii TaxID=1387555 RepID=A0ABY7BKB6_9FIRM|nr:Uma2 family endonuclease [Caldicellulosiruptor morganii]WAM33265.1 Uma2 family endonuclease [Caldicellulosiruptor morganii]
MEARIPKIYTYADYLQLPEDARVELIEGVIYDMSPAPSRMHQKIVSELTITIGSYLRQNKKTCEIYTAPFDVVLIEEGQDEKQAVNVVQPDISIICDKKKLTDKGCIGAPEMIIEVVSQNNPAHDYIRKLNLYTQFGVKEYWIVNPYEQNIFVYVYHPETGYSYPKVYTFNDKVKVSLFEDLIIDFAQIKEVL